MDGTPRLFWMDSSVKLKEEKTQTLYTSIVVATIWVKMPRKINGLFDVLN